MTILHWVLLAVGAAIIAGLAYYAGSLLARLKQQTERRVKAQEARNERLVESIVTIAKSMRQDQCPLSEGSIRLTVLLDLMAVEPKPNYAQRYPAIHDMYDRIKHMPTHEARKQYPKAEIKKLDREREGYEKELEGAIQADVHKLLEDF